MSDNKWTQGEWRLISSKVHIVADDKNGVSTVICRTGIAGQQGDEPPGTRERWEADAHLMAAAPELYYALENLLETCKAEPYGEEQRRAAISALAKARGES